MKILKIQYLLYTLSLFMVACGASDEVKNADKELQLAKLSAEDHSVKEVSEQGLALVGCMFVEGNLILRVQCQKVSSLAEKMDQEIAKKNYVNTATKRLNQSFSGHLRYTQEIIKNKKLSVSLPPRIPVIVPLSTKSSEKYLAKEALKTDIDHYYTYSFLINMLWLYNVDVHISEDNTITIGGSVQTLDLSQKAIDEAIEYLEVMEIFKRNGLEIKNEYTKSTMLEITRILEELK